MYAYMLCMRGYMPMYRWKELLEARCVCRACLSTQVLLPGACSDSSSVRS